MKNNFFVIYLQVPLAQSEVHISEMLDEICDKMDDYVRGTMKTTGELVVMKLMDEKNGMNPLISEIDIIQDGDLNKSLKYYVSFSFIPEENLFLNVKSFKKQ